MLNQRTFMLIVILLAAFSQVEAAFCSIHELFKSLQQNESNCVKDYEKGKIYIDPENLYIDNSGVHLIVNDEINLTIPYLLSDTKGCFIWDEFSGTGVPPFPLIYCSKCGFEHIPPPHQ